MARSIWLRRCASTPFSPASMPVPIRFRSRKPAFSNAPESVEKPPPSVSSPVAFSSMAAVTMARSGALPGLGTTWTLLKYPRSCSRCRDRRTVAALNASPSARRNSRRITLSLVRVLPVMSMRSTKTRGPSVMSNTRSTVFLSRLRAMRGFTSTKA